VGGLNEDGSPCGSRGNPFSLQPVCRVLRATKETESHALVPSCLALAGTVGSNPGPMHQRDVHKVVSCLVTAKKFTKLCVVSRHRRDVQKLY